MEAQGKRRLRKRDPFRHFRRNLITGLILLVPFAITYLVLRLIFNTIDGIIQPLIERSFDLRIPGLGIISLILLAYLVGLVGGNFLGRRLLRAGQGIIMNIPIVRAIYNPAKQLIESFTGSSATGFKRVVMLEYPRPGAWTVGFLTGVTKDENQRTLAVVYVPTAPTPQTGWVAILPMEEVYDTNLSVQDALNMVLSGGIISPPEIRKQAPLV